MTQVGRQFVLKVNNTDESVVQRFHEIVRLGRMYGPYSNSERDGHRRKPFWVWTASAEDALDVMQMLAPWLSDRRLERAHELTGIHFPVESLPI